MTICEKSPAKMSSTITSKTLKGKEKFTWYSTHENSPRSIFVTPCMKTQIWFLLSKSFITEKKNIKTETSQQTDNFRNGVGFTHDRLLVLRLRYHSCWPNLHNYTKSYVGHVHSSCSWRKKHSNLHQGEYEESVSSMDH